MMPILNDMKQSVNTIPMINISFIILVFWVNVTNEAKSFFTRCACLVLQADHLPLGIGESQVVRVSVDNLKAEVIHGQRVPVDRSDIATRSQNLPRKIRRRILRPRVGQMVVGGQFTVDELNHPFRGLCVVVKLQRGEMFHNRKPVMLYLFPRDIACTVQPFAWRQLFTRSLFDKGIVFLNELRHEGLTIFRKENCFVDTSLLDWRHPTTTRSVQTRSLATVAGVWASVHHAALTSGGKVSDRRHVTLFLAFDGFGVGVDSENVHALDYTDLIGGVNTFFVLFMTAERALAFFHFVFTGRAAHVTLRIDSCFCFHAPIVSKPRENASTKK